MFAEILERLANLEASHSRIIRAGEVVGIDEQRGTVRVQFNDADNVISYNLPVLFPKTHADKCIHMPDLGEHVACIFLPNGQEQGFVIGAFYSKADKVPVASRDKRHIRFRDGSWFEYDRAAHKLSGHVVDGDAELTVGKTAKLVAGVSATTMAPTIYLMGNVSQTDINGQQGTEIKNTITTHDGSYTLDGPMRVSDLIVDNNVTIGGNLTTDGNAHAETRTGGGS